MDKELLPRKEEERRLGSWNYMSLWLGDGVNMGNMTLGGSLVVMGVASMNIYQTFFAAALAIFIISLVFVLNDKPGYKLGIPYVMQLALSFGLKGSEIAALLRGIPAIVWYGFQTYIGATALNEIIKIISGDAFDGIAAAFVCLLAVQMVLSMCGFRAIKWLSGVVSFVIMMALLYVLFLLLRDHSREIYTGWVSAEGTWGLPLWTFTLAFLGNYAALFLSASDYSRELKTGFSDQKRGMLYFFPILLAYGTVLCIGAMLSSVTGISNPAHAISVLIGGGAITVFISLFIVLGAIEVNMVANIVAPTYIISRVFGTSYKKSVILTGIFSCCTCPWILVSDSSALGLTYFILIYSAFLGPMIGILLVEYYILRKERVNLENLYDEEGECKGYNKKAFAAVCIGAAVAFCQVELSWLLGFTVGAISYYILSRKKFLAEY